MSVGRYIIYLVFFQPILCWAQPPVFIKDEFNNNNQGWWIGKGENYSMKMENGKYVIETTQKDNGRFITINPYMDSRKDFSIEATFVQKIGK